MNGIITVLCHIQISLSPLVWCKEMLAVGGTLNKNFLTKKSSIFINHYRIIVEIRYNPNFNIFIKLQNRTVSLFPKYLLILQINNYNDFQIRYSGVINSHQNALSMGQLSQQYQRRTPNTPFQITDPLAGCNYRLSGENCPKNMFCVLRFSLRCSLSHLFSFRYHTHVAAFTSCSYVLFSFKFIPVNIKRNGNFVG